VARKPDHDQSHVIEEIEGIAERGAQWVRDHIPLSIAALVIILVGAGGLGAMASHRAGEADAASDALDRVSSDYMEAMGADPNALVVPELANPEAAEAIQLEFAEQFGAVADEHSGTVAAALARLEQGNLSAAAGDTDGAVEIWQSAIGDLRRNENLEAVLEQRIALAYENDTRWLEAADAYARAGSAENYPLRYWALAEAARCYQEAGETDRARELAQRISSESPDIALPQHLSAILSELRQTSAP
jgi:tetratricopeptide (TPR) repeat protein